jgi:tetratricopeptide (TPR) repeat protein
MKTLYLLILLAFATALESLEMTCPYGCDNESAAYNFYSLKYFITEAFPPDRCCVYHRFKSYEGYCNMGIFPYRKIYWFFDKDCPSLSCSFERYGYTTWIEEDSRACYMEDFAGCLNGLSFVQTELENYAQNEAACYKDAIQWAENGLAYFKDLQAQGFSSCCGGTGKIAEPIVDKIKQEESLLKNNKEKLDEVKLHASHLQEKFDILEQEVLEQYENQFQWCLMHHQWNGAYYGQGLLNFHRGELTEALDNIRNFIDGLKNEEKNQLSQKIYLKKGIVEAEVGLYDDAIISLSEALRKDPSCKEAYFERAAAYFEAGEFDLALKDYLASGMRPLQEDKTVSYSIDYASGLAKGIKKGFEEEFSDGLPIWASMLNGCLWFLTQSPLPQAKIVSATLACIGAAGAYLAAHQVSSELKDLVSNWDQLSDQQRGEMTGYLIGKHGLEVFVIAGSTKLMKAYRDLKRANNILTFEMMLVEESRVTAIKTRYRAIEKLRKDKQYIKKYFGKTNYSEQEIRDSLKTMGYHLPARPASIPQNFITRYSDKGCGITYYDPANQHEYVRLMPGNPQSSNPAQKQPYIIHMRNGKALDKKGTAVIGSSENAHIPAEEFIYMSPKK